jgi:hypothetical protein
MSAPDQPGWGEGETLVSGPIGPGGPFDPRPEQWQAAPTVDRHIVGHDFAAPADGTTAATE